MSGDPGFVSGKALLEFRLSGGADLLGKVEEGLAPVLEDTFGVQCQNIAKLNTDKVATLLQSGDGGNLLVKIQHFRTETVSEARTNGDLIVIDIDFLASQRGPSNASSYQAFLDRVRSALSDLGDNVDGWQQIPLLKLGRNTNNYLTTSDERVVEYPFTLLVHEQRSDFQLIQILDSVDHGRTLLLDGLVNLAESDTRAYTHKLMGLPENLPLYRGARVLILGGGDGALLKELLDLTGDDGATRLVAHVTMVDIDEAVMRACAQHLTSVCGDYLDRREGERFKVISGDAFAFMEQAKSNGTTFDVIFGDLTDAPVPVTATSAATNGDDPSPSSAWSLVEAAARGALQLLRPDGGRYLTHCNGKSAEKANRRFAAMLAGLGDGLDVRRRESFVPSFMEVWVFFELCRQGQQR